MSYLTLRILFVAAILPLAWAYAEGQAGPPAHPPRPKMVGPAKWNPSQQEVSAAYWTLEPGWNTDLEMRNNLGFHELTVTPVLRVSTGQEIPLAPVTVAAQHIVSLDLRSLVQSQAQILNGPGSFGSVAFRFSGLDSANLFAATIVRRGGQPIDFHFDADDAGPVYHSGGIEGIWWIPAATSTDYLILSNPLRKHVSASLLISGSSPVRRVPLSIGPGETKRIDMREMLGASANGGVGGLTLELPGNELISATQIVFDESTGLAAIMKLFEREPADPPKNRVLLAPMMALGSPDAALGFPQGTILLPRVFLRNAGPSTAQLMASITWHNQASGTFELPQMILSPGEVRLVNLSDYQQAGQIPSDANWGNLKMSYKGRRADLIAVAVSYDKDSRYGLQTPFSETLGRLWAGGMWHVDAMHNTLITTGNAGLESTTAEVTLFYNGGKSKYRLERELAPGQQLWLDVGHLIHDRIADSDGNTLPAEVMEGSYELKDLDHATVGQLYEGKLVIDKNFGHAAYGCASCCGYYTPSLDPSPFAGPPGVDNQDFIYAQEQCGGYVDDVTGAGYNWHTSDSSIATLPNRTLHTVAVGTARGYAYAQLQATHPAPQCPMTTWSPLQGVTVEPTVTISGSTYVAMLMPGTQGSDSTTLTATGNPSGGTYSWSIVSGEGNVTLLNATSQSAIIQSVAVGTYTAQVTYTVNNQQATATTVGKVQQPGSLLVISNDTPTFNCGNTGLPAYNTSDRLILYQVLDTSGPPAAPIPVANMNATESTLSVVSNDCNVNGPNPTIDAPTLSNGYFFNPDTLQLCSAKCLPAGNGGVPLGSCTMQVNQTWSVNGYPVKSGTITYTCPGPPSGVP